MTQLRLAFYPLDFSDPNNYLSRMRDAIVLAYPEIEIVNMPGRFKDFIKVDVVWLNWYENFPDGTGLTICIMRYAGY